MRYSVIHNMNHPRLCEDLSNKNIVFYDISDSYIEVSLLQNMMKDILNPSKHKNIRIVFEDFLKNRTLNHTDDNHTIQRLKLFFDVFEYHYKSKTGFNFYLVERKDNKIINIHNRWKCKREQQDLVKIPKKNKVV